MIYSIPPDKEGRRIYARSVFPKGKTPWIIPGAPDFSWYEFLVEAQSFLGATQTFLAKRHVDTVTVAYTEEWAGTQDPIAHEYKLMTPDQAEAANGGAVQSPAQ